MIQKIYILWIPLPQLVLIQNWLAYILHNNFQNRRIKKLCILNFRNSKSVCAVSIFTKRPFDFNQLGSLPFTKLTTNSWNKTKKAILRVLGQAITLIGKDFLIIPFCEEAKNEPRLSPSSEWTFLLHVRVHLKSIFKNNAVTAN